MSKPQLFLDLECCACLPPPDAAGIVVGSIAGALVLAALSYGLAAWHQRKQRDARMADVKAHINKDRQPDDPFTVEDDPDIGGLQGYQQQAYTRNPYAANSAWV